MCDAVHQPKGLSQPKQILIAALLGILGGFSGLNAAFELVDFLSTCFMKLLQLVSLPIISLSLISTLTSLEDWSTIKTLGAKVLKLTILTTVFAASTALCLYLFLDPSTSSVPVSTVAPFEANMAAPSSYKSYLLDMVPSNFLQPFVEHNVMGVLVIALLISFGLISLPEQTKKPLVSLFQALYAVIMTLTGWLVKLMPLAVFCFVWIFIKQVDQGLAFSNLGKYLGCVVGANLIQAGIILPFMLMLKNISPLSLFKAMAPALSVAFFSKSSAAALPVALTCAVERFKVTHSIAAFCFPLCTTINMNACAAFIITTVLFVAQSHGMAFSTVDMIIWVGIATITAIGNAGVPMGCFFLSSALLTTLDVPLTMMGIILPFYALIDMLESAINIWSDSCVTALVDKSQKPLLTAT